MKYKKCPQCELNYIKVDEDLCSLCKSQHNHNNGTRDVNKNQVEEVLLPLLRTFPQSSLDKLTKKKESFEFLGLRLPLLVECQDIDKEHCKKEVVVDSSSVYRYYIEPYNINGKKYHICSQWWSAPTNNSKDILELLKELNKK